MSTDLLSTATNAIGATYAYKNGDTVAATRLAARAAESSGIPGVENVGRTVGNVADTFAPLANVYQGRQLGFGY